MIALIVTGVLTLSCVGFGIIGGALLWSDPDVQRVVRGVGAGVELIDEAMKAPGTQELREAGCDIALVWTPEQMRRFRRALEDSSESDHRLRHRILTCQTKGPPVDCETVAQVYGQAVADAPAEYAVTSQREGDATLHCRGIYDREGHYVRTFDEANEYPTGL
jgi:hypothetical protein